MEDNIYDSYFTKESMENMTTVLSKYYSEFDREKFLNLVFDSNWNKLFIMKKVRHVALCLHDVMPESFEETINIFIKAIPEIEWWESVTFPDYVAVYGQDHWDISMYALTEFTKHSSSEFAIRPFLINKPKETAEYLLKLTEYENENVRRYASEGCRPSHPWGIGLPLFKKEPAYILPILEKLKNDESEYVRRSVANNLNAISRDNPDVILDIAEQWYGKTDNTDSLIKHACRTLLKKGDRRAMKLFGLGNSEKLDIRAFELTSDSIIIGERMGLSFTLEVNDNKERLVRMEYAVHFLKANGTLARKVYKISEKNHLPGSYRIKRKGYEFIERTTRKLYEGTQAISIIVNGDEKERIEFELIK